MGKEKAPDPRDPASLPIPVDPDTEFPKQDPPAPPPEKPRPNQDEPGLNPDPPTPLPGADPFFDPKPPDIQW